MEGQLKEVLKNLKENESVISMFLGGLVMLVVAVLLISYFRSTSRPQITSESSSTISAELVLKEGEEIIRDEFDEIESGFDAKELESADDEIVVNIELPEDEVERGFETKDTHMVQKGENLWVIAEKHFNSGYNWIDIAKENNLEAPGQINEGSKLKIPKVESKLITKTMHEDLSESQDDIKTIKGTTYKVVAGDSLWKISLRAYSDGYRWMEIWKVNKEIIKEPNLIEIGQEFTIPR